MGADSFKGIVIGFSLFVLFAFIMFQWVINMGDLNGIDTSGITIGSLNPENFNNSVIDVNNTGQTGLQIFNEGGVTDIDDPRGVFKVINSIRELVITPFALIGGIFNTLEVPVAVTTLIVGLLSIVLILGVWRLLRSGD